MKILTLAIEQKIKSCIIEPLLQKDYISALQNIAVIFDNLYAAIPDNKRISNGRVYIIRILSDHLLVQLKEIDAPLFDIAASIFMISDDYKSQGVALALLSWYGLADYNKVIPYFELAAKSSNWDVREMSQMFFKKLIKNHPNEMKDYLQQLVKSENLNLRRFVAETLRPVQENKWFYGNPEYPLSILRNLFREDAAYPRTAVGNNLSDLARRLPDLVYELVQELVESGDKNSYWIAYRACRNLVKKDPIKVMDLLKVDKYKYKNRIYQRSDYQRN
ncbi:MAG: DNA alkylation repair protein [candidate division KSB1 bacterium]|nr:DNA alkylation repair protein [candidate division KSB1 bacterium]MDZ7340970.1 DNA alkylation repair protein [candidate division KSB1 bacterium]